MDKSDSCTMREGFFLFFHFIDVVDDDVFFPQYVRIRYVLFFCETNCTVT